MPNVWLSSEKRRRGERTAEENEGREEKTARNRKERKLQLRAARDEEKKLKEVEKEEAKKKRAEEKAWHVSSQTRKRNYDKGSSKEPIAGPSNQGAGRTLRSYLEKLQD